MILQELTLFNYCLYAGEQVINLAPTQSYGKHRPIVLCGGINGGGKTTLLDAVQLALYGNRAKTSKRAGLPYEEFLRECIHRDVPPSDGAFISLSFQYASEGKDHHYEVRRRWEEKGSGIKEYLQVFKNGDLDSWLSENWNTIVEELIPLGVSKLFFFDAEQIRFLADEDSTNEDLSTAIKSLLGLDLAERLISDAKVVQSRLAKEVAADTAQSNELAKLNDEISAKEDEKRKLRLELASLESDFQRAEEESHRAEMAFAAIGGQHWKNRSALTEQEKSLNESKTTIENELSQLAEGAIPLQLVAQLLRQVSDQNELELTHRNANVLADTLAKRDEILVAEMESARLAKTKLKLLKDFLAQDRAARQTVDQSFVPIHNLSKKSQSSLSAFFDDGFDSQKNVARKLLAKLEKTKHDLETIERSLAAAPKEDSLKEVAVQLKEANRNAAVASDRIGRIEKEIASVEYQLSILQRDYERMYRDQIQDELASEEARRISKLSDRTQTIMQEFLQRSTNAKIDRLSARVTESFRYLLRKKELVDRIEISPINFSFVIYDSDGKEIPKSRLSEGEKQIFAISVLWGLARASARHLPAIIDTPMARLDAKHRDHLVERYFPNASHQVIILSTDTEIDADYYEALAPDIARSYHLNYDEKIRQTTVEDGYFNFGVAKPKALRGAGA